MTDILPRDVLLYAGGDAWKRFGTFTRRSHRIQRGGEGQQETFTRADAAICATIVGADWLLRTAAANIMRPEWADTNGDGLTDTLTSLHEQAATNRALWCRDLTNVAWAKTSCTAAKDQTGVDGAATSASSLTASGANATCLQAITLASSLRVQSAFVKRLAGSGTIQMTTDGGTTWTAIAVTAAWVRVQIPAQIVTNPSFGFRIVTNGDAIAVDYVQNENAAAMTSALATTSSVVSRAADACTVAVQQDVLPISLYAKFIERGAIAMSSGAPRVLAIEGGTASRIILYQTAGKYACLVTDPNSVGHSVAAAAAPNFGDVVELVGSYDGASTISITQAINGVAAAAVTSSGITPFAGLWGAAQLGIFCSSSGGSNSPGALIRAVLAQGVHTLAEFQAVP